MSSPGGAQPPLCSYSPLSMRPQAAPHQATVHTLLPPPVPSSSSFSFSLSLPSPRSTPACVLTQVCVVGCPPYEVTGSWGTGHRLHMCLSPYVSSSFTVLYNSVFTLLQSPSILLYCIVTLHSHINFTKGTITHKQTNLLYSHYCTVLYC